MLTPADVPLLLRADADDRIGTGHVMRCLALAEYWVEQGGLATILGHAPAPLRTMIAERGIAQVTPMALHPHHDDLAQCLVLAGTGSIIVVDGRRFDVFYERRLAEHHVLMVIDDLAERDAIGGHLLLNQNAGAERRRYAAAPAHRLLGLRHALLRSEFRVAPGQASGDVPEVARNVLVTLGGADPAGLLQPLLQQLLPALPAGTTVRVAAGTANRRLDALAAWCHRQRGIEVIERPHMVELMQWADVALSAAGTTAIELARMGVPAVLVAIADDQVAAATELHRMGAAVHAGNAAWLPPDQPARALIALMHDPAARQRMSDAARFLVDGDGCARVAAALCTHEEVIREPGQPVLGL